MIVLIFVIGENAIDALADHAEERLVSEIGVALVVQSCGELLGKFDVIVELSDRQEAGIAGERCGRNLDFDGFGGEKVEGKEWDRV